jgi:hypothetical protein
MTKPPVIFTLLLSVVCLSCTKVKQENPFQKDEAVTIEFSNANAAGDSLSTLFKSSQLIKLETLPHSLLADISKVKKLNNSFYILTEGKNNGLFKFDQTGKFIQQMLQPGNGPGEYGFIENFDIDGGIIYLLDNKKLSIHKVDTAGNFLKTIQTGLFGLDILKHKEFMFLYAGNNLNNGQAMKLLALNEEGEIQQSFLPVSEKQALFLHINPKGVFSEKEDSFSFMEPFGYSKMDYTQNTLSRSPIKFEGISIPENFLTKEYDHIGHFLQAARKENIPILFSDFLDSEKFFMFSVEYKGIGKRMDIWVDKETNMAKVVEQYIDDMLFQGQSYVPTALKYVGFNEDSLEIIYYIDSPDLDERLDASKKEQIQLKSSDNPYLIILKK